MFARAEHPQAVVVRDGGGRLPKLPWRVFVLVLVGALSFALIGALVDRLRDPGTLPIRKIRVEGALNRVNEAMLRQAVAGKVQGGYFSVDVVGVRGAVEALPWVSMATVRRLWPDTLQLRVVEQVPLAIWNDGELVNVDGEVFRPDEDTWPTGLPRLRGPEGQARLLSESYRTFSRILAPAKLTIAGLAMDARHAFRLTLSNGIRVQLGREAVEMRLRRFARVYRKALAAEAERIARVDLRYGSGLAVQWKKNRTQTTHGG